MAIDIETEGIHVVNSIHTSNRFLTLFKILGKFSSGMKSTHTKFYGSKMVIPLSKKDVTYHAWCVAKCLLVTSASRFGVGRPRPPCYLNHRYQIC